MKLSINVKFSFAKNRLTAKEQNHWDSYFNLTHYQEKTPEDKKPVSLEAILKKHHR